ncbi:uncharacterized protein LOC127648641 [Xyrauchen texanus]|uniref:uncharacterized protein LOC127648641 n=1 Tax=Xyrauchen texanus TaxID=154827 RepID=UPI002241D2F4|nr:uncharacterized protein LOC127648641 [Xyrauchen texanus]
MALRWMLVFVVLLDNTVSSSEDTLFVQTGGSVTLDIQTHELPEFDDLVWINEKYDNINILKYINASKTARLHTSYKNRMYFNTETFSLTLKNMQKTDSGVYRASASGEFNIIVAKHRVSVMDPVEAPVLSENFCSFTCIGHHFTISSTYNNSCFQEEVRSSGNYTLSLYCSGDFIICNHSNPVSWMSDTKEVNESCTINKDTRSTGPQSEYISWLIPLIFLLALVVAVVGFCFCRNKKDAQEGENTIYAEVTEDNKPKPQEMLEKSENPKTVYDTAGAQPCVTMETNLTTPNPDSMNQNAAPTEKSDPDKPVTVYCAIQKHSKPLISETENTIYAVVNKTSACFESAQ